MSTDNNDLKTLLEKSRNGENILYESPYLICSFNTRQEDRLYILAKVEKEPDKTDYMLLSAFMMNASLAIDYHILSASKTRSQKNMLYFLSEVIEPALFRNRESYPESF